MPGSEPWMVGEGGLLSYRESHLNLNMCTRPVDLYIYIYIYTHQIYIKFRHKNY